MVSQVGPYEEIQKRLRKSKFVILTVPRNRRHNMSPKATLGSTNVCQEAKGRIKGRINALDLIGVSMEKAKKLRIG